MRFPKRTVKAVAGSLLLAGALAACSAIPPTHVGDVLDIGNTEVSFVALDHLNPEVRPSSLTPNSLFLTLPDRPTDSVLTVLGGVVANARGDRPGVPDPLPDARWPAAPPTIPSPPFPDTAETLLMLIQNAADYVAGAPAPADSLPDNLTPGSYASSASAARTLMDERMRLREEELNRRRQEQDNRRNVAMQQLLAKALARQAEAPDDPEFRFELPLPFYVEASDLGLDLPSLGRLLVGGFRQNIGIGQITLQIPDDADFTEDDFEDFAVEGISISVVASQKDSSDVVSSLLMHDETYVPAEPIQFSHQGDGVYTPADPDATFLVLRLDRGQARALFDALIDGNAILGNADIAISLTRTLDPSIGMDFTFKTDGGYILP